MNLLEIEAAHQRAKYLKYKNLNKAFSNKNTPREETFILEDTSDNDSSSRSEAYNSRDENEKASITYEDYEISNRSISSEGKN